MNIYDISKLSGYSVTTVSRVLNGSDKVNKTTKQKILDTIKESGYTPNAFARSLGLNTMRTVGILAIDPADPNACTNLAKSIGYLQKELRKHNFDAVLYCVDYEMKGKAQSIKSMLERRVDAIIIVGSFFVESNPKNNECIIDAAKATPVWLINGNLEGENIRSVLCDDVKGTYKATETVIMNGSSDILFLYYSMTESAQRKIRGYKEALNDNKITIREEFIRCCPRDIDAGKEYIDELANSGFKFDSIVTSEDTIAISVLKYAHNKNVKIPDNLSIVGNGNSILATCCYPELTSVNSNIEIVCTDAVSMLVKSLEGGEVPAKTVVPADIVKRSTTH